jgi:GNAT superfamily N-acetyltransferase
VADDGAVLRRHSHARRRLQRRRASRSAAPLGCVHPHERRPDLARLPGARINVRLRTARSADLGFLRQALAWAADWREEEADLRVLADPEIARYLENWKREGDFGVIAEGDDGLVGAAWWRHFSDEDHGFGYVASDTPEVTIAVAPENRGRGVGTALLSALADQARSEGIPALSLSVEEGNASMRLYERVGFQRVADTGGAVTMKLVLR